MSRLLVLGAGGHAKVVLDIAVGMGAFDQIGFLDDDATINQVWGYPIIGKVEEYAQFISEYDQAIVAIGNNKVRGTLIEKLKDVGYTIPTLIHTTAYVSPFAHIERGTVVMAKAVVNANASIGEGVIINTGAIVEHDNQIASGVHISPNVSLGGTVKIGKNTWIGIGATVIHNIEIAENVIVGAGSVVIRNIKAGQTVKGVPAK